MGQDKPIGRRELLGILGAGALAAHRPADLLAQDQPIPFTGIDHFEFYVSNVEKSRDFYVRLFGNNLLSRNNKRYLKLGSCYMAFETPRGNTAAGQVDHVSIAIKNLDMAKLHSELQHRGITYQDYPSGRDTGVLDPDGIRLQLSPENGWGLLNPATFLPETVAFVEPAIFNPITIDRVFFNVTDIEKAVAHYRNLLGPPSSRGADGTWFQIGSARIGFSSNQKPGVQYIALSAKVSKLQDVGTKAEPTIPGAIAFRDPDGLLIQIVPVS